VLRRIVRPVLRFEIPSFSDPHPSNITGGAARVLVALDGSTGRQVDRVTNAGPMASIDARHDTIIGDWVNVDAVEDFVIAGTDYHSSQYKTNALKVLETEDKIEVDSTTRKKKGTYPSGTLLRWKR
jgi:hypothetical protein